MPAYKKVLVTGGAGFIGNRLVRLLSEAGSHVAVVDNEFSKMKLQPASERVTPFNEDIRNHAGIDAIVEKFAPEAVIHLAAVHHIPTCEQKPHLAMDVNVLGTQCVLDAMQKHKVGNLVMASSSAVYDWHDAPLVEDETPLRATDVYSTSKLTNEHQAQVWAERTGGRVGIARIFNVIGHDDPNGHIIPDILKQIDIVKAPKTAVIRLGNTKPKRDYTHADDTAAGLFAMLSHLQDGRAVEAYNISWGKEFSVVDLVAEIGRYLGCEISIETDPSRVRRVDRLHLLGDQKKTHGKLGWKAQIPFEEALNRILTHLAPHVAASKAS